MTGSNTKDCFREFIGQRVKGVLFDALPAGRGCLAAGTKSLIFDDGRALTIADNGSFWIDGPLEVDRAISKTKTDLENAQKELAGVLALASPPPPTR